MSAVNQPSPTEIIGKVMSGDAVESVHPLLEPTIVGVHVLDVIHLADHPNARSQIDWAMSNADFTHSSTQGPTAVGAKNRIACQQRLERRADVLLVSLLQYEVGCIATTVTANQHRNLFGGQTTLRGFAATFMGLALHAVFFTLERLKKVGFISLGNANQARGFLPIRQREKTVTPKKGGIAMYSANFCAAAYAFTFGQLLRVFQPLFLVAQPSQRCSGQRIEGGPAGSAAVTLQTGSRTPARNVVVTALGAQRCGQHTAFNQRTDGLNVLNPAQVIYQQASLMRRQFFKFCRQYLEFFDFHHSTYLVDWYDDSIDLYLTVT
jgi:hypothetical protein